MARDLGQQQRKPTQTVVDIVEADQPSRKLSSVDGNSKVFIRNSEEHSEENLKVDESVCINFIGVISKIMSKHCLIVHTIEHVYIT